MSRDKVPVNEREPEFACDIENWSSILEHELATKDGKGEKKASEPFVTLSCLLLASDEKGERVNFHLFEPLAFFFISLT